jgi:hypothetical protein
MDFKKIILTIFAFSLLVFLGGCSLWPYKRDFDCPVGQGVKCKSLYEISKMADRGEFGPDAVKKSNIDKKSENSNRICSTKRNCRGRR